ncbi:pilus assembly protein [Thermosulfidibacter takaii]|nr:hypothetical protein [Thermosulfidibacter takaii]
MFSHVHSEVTNYCAIPPFLTTAVPPNILLVIDVSGSMDWSAYNPGEDRTGWCTNSNGCGWTYTGNEEGYFIPNKVYRYNDSEGYWEQTDDTDYEECPKAYTDIDYDKRYLGSCLNFLFMSRIDLVRWAITGGRPADCDYSDDFTTTECDPDIECEADYCILEASPQWEYVKVPKSRIAGILQIMEKESTKPRFGAIFYSGSGLRTQKIYIGDYPYTGSSINAGNADSEKPYTYLKRFINRIEPWDSTPTAIALWEAYDYFKQKNDHNYANGFNLINTSDEDTYYRDPHYFCDANKENCHWAPCAKDFVILLSDGQWNTGGTYPHITCSIDDGFENYSADPVVPAYRMHHDVLRSVNSTSNVEYQIRVQALYALGLFLGGTGEQSLKNVAMYGSYDLNNGDWPDSLSGYPSNNCTMDDCCDSPSCGKGSACTPLPLSSSDWDKVINNNGTPGSDGIPDTFLNAKNAYQIKKSILQFIRNILAKTSSGTSVSVLSEKAEKGANLIQALFYPKKTFSENDTSLSWIGYLNNLWLVKGWTPEEITIREDSDNDTALGLSHDKIVEFNYESGQLKILLFSDNNSDGVCDNQDASGNCIGGETATFDTLKKVWEAGEILHEESANDRVIWTAINLNGDSQIDKNDAFSATYVSQLNKFLYASNSTEAEQIINYVRGIDISGTRSRTVQGNTWKLGDIIYSTPQVADYLDPKNPSKSYSVIYVGANDGMLHAFRLGNLKFTSEPEHIAKLCNDAQTACYKDKLGHEMWALVPKNVLPYLKYLKDPNYCHLYYVDLTPFIFDIDTTNGTKKILIGGLRLGGACACTGDKCVTAPVYETKDGKDYCIFDNGTENLCDANSDGIFDEGVVGLSSYFALDVTDPENPIFLWEFTVPELGFSITGPAYLQYGNATFVVFGSGPTNYSGDSFQNLKFFALKVDPDTFAILSKQIIDTGIANAFGGRLFTINREANTYHPTFVGYTQYDNGTWKGGIYKLYIDNGTIQAQSYMSNIGPVTASVRTASVEDQLWLLFGEGRYWTGATDDPTSIRRIYAVNYDNCQPTCSIDSLSDVTEEVNGTAEAYTAGWYIKLSGREGSYNAERLITDPLYYKVRDKYYAFYVTFQPTSDICGFGGRTFVWAVEMLTGGQIQESTFGGKLFVQTSTGQIATFSKKASGSEPRKLGPVQGVPSENAPTFVAPSGRLKRQILYWLEK